MSTGGSSILRELFEQRDIHEVIRLIEGNFAAVLVGKDNHLFIFADELNRTEVFYSRKENGIVVSTDLDPVISSLEKITYSQVALANLLSIYGYYAPKNLTIYKEIQRLGVGEYLEAQGNTSKVRQLGFTPLASRKYGEREQDEYAKILEEAVRTRGSDRCNWVFLSSGWDSTSLLAFLVRLYGASKVRCVIGEMKYSERSSIINQFELDRAQKVADYYGVQLDVVPLNLCRQEAVDYWKSIAPSLKQQHIYSFSAYNYYRLSEFVQKNGGPRDAVFAGEISDGVHNLGFSQFATILEHPDLGFREYSDKMASYLFGPTFFKSVLGGGYHEDFVFKLMRDRVGADAFDDMTTYNEKMRRLKYFASFFLRNVRVPFYSHKNSTILTDKGADMVENELSGSLLKDAADSVTPETLYSWLLHMYNSFFWQGGTVRCLGAKLAESGGRLKLPFWDGRLHQFLHQMPEDWGRGLELKPTKYPLKWTLANKVDYPIHLQTGPHSYLYDVNPQFSHASEILFGSFVSSHYKNILTGYPYEKILDGEYFKLEYLRGIVDKYKNGIEFGGQERTDLMALVTFCNIGWYE
jgi:hypothetical protein